MGKSLETFEIKQKKALVFLGIQKESSKKPHYNPWVLSKAIVMFQVAVYSN